MSQAAEDNKSENRDDKKSYAAFISYRRVDPDSMSALRLQNFLESYRTPRRLVNESGIADRIGRIFVDTEELATSSDLPETIRETLLASDRLIVVCSPRSRQSQWVAEETQFFVREKGRDNVLLFMIDGTPVESFPLAILTPDQPRTDLLTNSNATPLAAEPSVASLSLGLTPFY